MEPIKLYASCTVRPLEQIWQVELLQGTEKYFAFFCCQINSLRWFDVFGQSNRLSQLDNLNYWNQFSFMVQLKTCS